MSLALTAFRAAGLAASVAGVFFLVYPLAAAPTGEPPRLGLRGLKRRRALEQNELWAEAEPAVRWLARRLRGWIPEERAAALDTQIALAGDLLGLVPEELVALGVLLAAVGTLVGAVLGHLSGIGHLVTMVGFGYGLLAPHFFVSNARAERFKAVGRRLPHAIDLMALAMSAGLDFPGSVRQVVEKAGDAFDPLIEELTLVLQSLRLGRSRREALEELARRVPCDAVIDFVGSVVQGELRGTPIAHVLQIQAEVSRQRRSVRAEESAAKAGVRLMVPLVMVFLCVMLLVVAPVALRLAASGM